ncbi:hypothetical protein CVT24_012305 [Panaeolus cyanescens]|uniref:Uncharacterized protein n=1 Tax=Panaeolus cyanescens TaxID=181874 RepID=A0A409YJ29_9AGAR|nr:hypothetical protein CVT24_012305 [Panaeolus cyanescens]
MQLFFLITLLPFFVNAAFAAPAELDPTTITTVSVAATAPPVDTDTPLWLGVHLINDADRIDPPGISKLTDNQALSKRQLNPACYTSSYNINRADLTKLSSSLQNNNPWQYVYLPHGYYVAWSLGTAILCVYNRYLTENTHLARWEAGWAIAHIQNSCSWTGTSGVSKGGSTTCHGDSGLSLQAVIRKHPQEKCV